jgi:dihydroflavonol-4-reductase
MVGRYYWYDHARASSLGYHPRPARQALADAIAWLMKSGHISVDLRQRLNPTAEVFASMARV